VRTQICAARLIVSTAVRKDWKKAVGTLVEPVAQISYPLFGLWISLIADGVVERRPALIWAGIAGVAFFQSTNNLALLYGAGLRIALAEIVGSAFDREIATLTSSLPGLEHQESPDYRDRIELLRQTQGLMGQSFNAIVNAMNAVAGAVVVLVLLATASPICLGLVVFCLPSLWGARSYQRWVGAAEEESAQRVRLARHFQELMVDPKAAPELRLEGIEKEILIRHRTAWLASQSPILRAERRRVLIAVGEQVLFLTGFIAIVAVTIWRAKLGQATVGDVILVIVVGLQVQERVLAPIYAVADLGPGLRAAGRILWLRDYAEKAMQNWLGNRPMPVALRDGIMLENVTFAYPGTQRSALKDISVRLPAGCVVGVVGENGAGKSSFIKLLCRFYDSAEGRIMVDGVNITEFDVAGWRSRISAAFQDFARLELLVREAVGVGDLRALDSEPAIETAVRRAGADGVLRSLPSYLDTQLGSTWRDGVDLSVGQWQKLALARTFMREDPLLVILDEPTASLDAPTENAVFERFSEVARDGRKRGSITILVSHRFSTVRMADLILVLDDGRLIECGTHAELIQLDGHYADLYRLQAEYYL
jgi:ATP-binding cassette, subfamily B, bacterial